MNARSLARALGGDVVGSHQVVCPGPGHSPKDRSLSVFIDWQAPDGFRVHSHAVPRDDWQACRDHVKQRLGQCCTAPRPRQTFTAP
jgi:putative DNA primase/helicase